MSPLPEYATPIAAGVTCVDCDFIRAGAAACYLLERNGEVALIDTGTRHSLARIQATMQALNLAPAQLRYVIPTHVHLDHAGGAGAAMDTFTEARLIVHPRGARHMIDPSRLVEGVKAVYGEAAFAQLYGKVSGIEAARVTEAPDEFQVPLGASTLRFLDTPGHARHHFCVLDERDGNLFSGDTCGISYRASDSPAGPFLVATTTPVQFEPDAWRLSLARLRALRPTRLLLTHFGAIAASDANFDQLEASLDHHVHIARQHHSNVDRVTTMTRQLLDDWHNSLRSRGLNTTPEMTEDIFAMDAKLNAQGLDVWLTHTQRP